VVVLSRDEVMEVLPESDWAHLADARGVVAEQWLCFFTKQGHCAEGHSEVAAWQYFNGMSQEDQQSYGKLLCVCACAVVRAVRSVCVSADLIGIQSSQAC
jgi:hypothetical protein